MKFYYSVFAKMAMAATLSFAFLPLSIPAVRADSPAMNITEYELDGNKVEECVNTAEMVMKEQGFQELTVSERDVFGSAGDISVEMYCVRDGKTLILVLAGSDSEELQKLQSTLDKRLAQ